MSGEEVITIQFRSERGAILFLTLGIMVILLSLGLMFAAVSTSRHVITNNQKDALKARCIAESGIAVALSQLAIDPDFHSDIEETEFGGGTYSVDIYQLSDTEVELKATGEYGRARYRACVVVEVPPPTGSVYAWALREGDPASSWEDSSDAHDDARGPNTHYAVIKEGQIQEQGLAGFRFDSMYYPIEAVEFVIHYYIPDMANFDDGELEVRWRRPSDDKKSPWVIIENSELIAAAPGGWGFIAVETTNEAPPEGWNWNIFTPEPDFQIEIKQSEYDDDERLYIDCAGFRISW